jgi:acyl-coenzyme A thioesterase PaaI-like protein
MIHSVTELPFNRHVGIQRADSSSRVLQLPAGQQFLNHVGTVHASAQLALAEASSGEFLLRHFGPDSGIVPVVRRVEAKFRKPANGQLTSTVKTPNAVLVQLQTELASKGRSFVNISVDLHDESGQHTLEASFEWFVTSK